MFLWTVAVVAVLWCAGCGPDARAAQARTADTVARVTNATLPAMVRAYELEGDRAIDRASSREEAEAALAKVRDKWRPIWAALEVFATAHDAWSTALEADEPTAALAVKVRAAYCALRSAASGSVDLPDFPLVPCDGGSP
jgi:hypothetical protein